MDAAEWMRTGAGARGLGRGLLVALLLAVDAGRAEPWQPPELDAYREAFAIDPRAEAALRADLGGDLRVHHSPHFALFHAPEARDIAYRARLLESVYAAFVLYFDTHGGALERPEHVLPLVLLPTQAAFVRAIGVPDLDSEISGLYVPGRKLGLFFDTLGRREVREGLARARDRESELAALRRRVRRSDADRRWRLDPEDGVPRRLSRDAALAEIERRLRRQKRATHRLRESLGQEHLEVMTHETVHQLSDAMGLLPADAPTPLWVTEGLATFFEPSAHGHLRETGAVHWRRWDRLVKAHADGRRIGLVDLLTKDRLLREAAGSALAYDEA